LELFPYLSALLIEEVERQPDKVMLRTRMRATTAACRRGRIRLGCMAGTSEDCVTSRWVISVS
jgi:hypothetical protein